MKIVEEIIELEREFDKVTVGLYAYDYIHYTGIFETVINNIIDSQIDIYYADLYKFSSGHPDAMERAIWEGIYQYDGSNNYDYAAHIQAAEYLYYLNIIYKIENKIYLALALSYLDSQGINEITEEQFEEIERLSDNTNTNEYIEIFFEEIEKIVQGEEVEK